MMITLNPVFILNLTQGKLTVLQVKLNTDQEPTDGKCNVLDEIEEIQT